MMGGLGGFALLEFWSCPNEILATVRGSGDIVGYQYGHVTSRSIRDP